MSAYIVRRVLWLIPVLLVVSAITFTLMHMAPGGPWAREKRLPASAVAALNRAYNLDKPVWEQYGLYVWNASHGDLGPSMKYIGRNVTDILAQGFPVTAHLGFMALGVALILGLPLGVAAAIRQNSMIDYASMFFAIVGVCTPSFILGILRRKESRSQFSI